MNNLSSDYLYSEMKEQMYISGSVLKLSLFTLVYISSFIILNFFFNPDLNDQTVELFLGVMALVFSDYISGELLISLLETIKNPKIENKFIFSKKTYCFFLSSIAFIFIDVFLIFLLIKPNLFLTATFEHVSIIFGSFMFSYLLIRIPIYHFIKKNS